MSKKLKLPRLVQVMPPGPAASFTVIDGTPRTWLGVEYHGKPAAPYDPGPAYFHVKIRDWCSESDRPEYAHRLIKDRRKWPTPHAVAVAACSHGRMNEGLGWVFLTRWVDGWPDLQAVYVSNSLHVLCVRTTSPDEAPLTHPVALGQDYRALAAEAISAARVARGGEPVGRADVCCQPVPADLFPSEWLPDVLAAHNAQARGAVSHGRRLVARYRRDV